MEISENNKEWIELTYFYVKDWFRNRTVYGIDIQEIQHLASIRVWNKKNLLDKNKPIKPWIKTVVSNFCKNKTRDYLADKRNGLKYSYGEISVYNYNSLEDELVNELNPLELLVYQNCLIFDLVPPIAEKLKIKSTTIHGVKRRIRKKYLKLLNN